MNWDDLRFLLAIARGTSLSGAARSLGVNQSTVSRRLATMEDRLNTRLVERGAEGLGLTAAGSALVETARRIETDLQVAEARIIGQDSRTAGRLTVTCPDILLDRYLAPHLASFAWAHPEIDLHVVSAFSPIDLMQREADVAIRISAAPPDTLVGRRACGFAMTAYIRRADTQTDAEAPRPETLDWIGWMSDDLNEAMITTRHPGAVPRHRTDGMVALRALVRAGLGASVLPCYWADADPDLRRVQADTPPALDTDIWVLAHPDLAGAARVRLFTDFIFGVIRRDRALFEGQSARPGA